MLVLAVPAQCAEGYGAERAREENERGLEATVGRSAAGAQVDIAEGMSPHPLRRYMDFLC